MYDNYLLEKYATNAVNDGGKRKRIIVDWEKERASLPEETFKALFGEQAGQKATEWVNQVTGEKFNRKIDYHLSKYKEDRNGNLIEMSEKEQWARKKQKEVDMQRRMAKQKRREEMAKIETEKWKKEHDEFVKKKLEAWREKEAIKKAEAKQASLERIKMKKKNYRIEKANESVERIKNRQLDIANRQKPRNVRDIVNDIHLKEGFKPKHQQQNVITSPSPSVTQTDAKKSGFRLREGANIRDTKTIKLNNKRVNPDINSQNINTNVNSNMNTNVNSNMNTKKVNVKPTPQAKPTPQTPPTQETKNAFNGLKESLSKVNWKKAGKIGAGVGIGAGLAYGAKKIYDNKQNNKEAHMNYLDDMLMEKMARNEADIMRANRRKKNKKRKQKQQIANARNIVDKLKTRRQKYLEGVASRNSMKGYMSDVAKNVSDMRKSNSSFTGVKDRKFKVKPGAKISDAKTVNADIARDIKSQNRTGFVPHFKAKAKPAEFNWNKAGKIGAGVLGAGALAYGAKKMYDKRQSEKAAYESYLDELFMEKVSAYDQNNMPLDNPLKALSGKNNNKRMPLGTNESDSEVAQGHNPTSSMGKMAESLLGSFEDEMEKAASELYDSLGIPQECLEKEESDEMLLRRQYLDLFNSPNLKW